MICSVCGKPGGLVVLDGGPCMPCVRARHRAAITHRCSCGSQRIPAPLARIGSRSWIACNRCLGTIRQVS